MALVKCPECGRDGVSNTAISCPSCGFNVKEFFENQSSKIETTTTTTTSTTKIAKLKQCDKCNKKIHTANDKCPYCGAEYSDTIQQDPVQQGPAKRVPLKHCPKCNIDYYSNPDKCITCKGELISYDKTINKNDVNNELLEEKKDNQNEIKNDYSNIKKILLILVIVIFGLKGFISCCSSIAEDFGNNESQYDIDYRNAMDKWNENYSTDGMTEGEKKHFMII